MKFVNAATVIQLFFSAQVTTATLRGRTAQHQEHQELVLLQQKRSLATSRTTNQQINIAGINNAASDCIDIDSLCATYLELAVVGVTTSNNINDTNTTTTNATNTILYAEAAAAVLCASAKVAVGLSNSRFDASVDFSVTQTDGDVTNIELQSDVTHITQAISISQTATVDGAASGSIAFAYVSQSDLRDSLSQSSTANDIALYNYTCTDNAVVGEAESFGIAFAQSMSTSVAAAFAGGKTSTNIEVNGRDIQSFKASVITGASSFAGAGSESLSLSFSAAFSSTAVAVESFEVVCSDWYAGYCGVTALDTELALLVCATNVEEVCSNIHDIDVAGADSFAGAYSKAATEAVSKSESTLGFEVYFKRDNGIDLVVLDVHGLVDDG